MSNSSFVVERYFCWFDASFVVERYFCGLMLLLRSSATFVVERCFRGTVLLLLLSVTVVVERYFYVVERYSCRRAPLLSSGLCVEVAFGHQFFKRMHLSLCTSRPKLLLPSIGAFALGRYFCRRKAALAFRGHSRRRKLLLY